MDVCPHPRSVFPTLRVCFRPSLLLLTAVSPLCVICACCVKVTPELVQSMRKYFAPFNAELQELLGRPLPENWSLPPDSGG